MTNANTESDDDNDDDEPIFEEARSLIPTIAILGKVISILLLVLFFALGAGCFCLAIWGLVTRKMELLNSLPGFAFSGLMAFLSWLVLQGLSKVDRTLVEIMVFADSIYLRLQPHGISYTILRDQISKAEICEFNAFFQSLKYGGRRYKFTTDDLLRLVLYTHGFGRTKGVRLTLKDGHTIYLGTNRAEELLTKLGM